MASETALTSIKPASKRRPRRPTPESRALFLQEARLRSALANGETTLVDIDHRRSWMRRLKDLVLLHEDQLAGDISESERRLIRRAAMLTLQLEFMEARWAAGDGEAHGHQLDQYSRVTASLAKLLQTLGLKRRVKDITTLSDLIRQDQEEQRRARAREREQQQAATSELDAV